MSRVRPLSFRNAGSSGRVSIREGGLFSKPLRTRFTSQLDEMAGLSVFIVVVVLWGVAMRTSLFVIKFARRLCSTSKILRAVGSFHG